MVNAILVKSSVPKDIIHPVEDIRKLIQVHKDIRINYCNRVCNKDADRMTRSAHVYLNRL